MSNYTALQITSAHDIDLGKHGVIEAHAGTGKTYTIVQMVLAILQKPVYTEKGDLRFCSIREILLVTFTEKAAGELTTRIRDGISTLITALKNDGQPHNNQLIAHLENSLNTMHEALIGTIHGVCLRLLQTWPFETGIHFETEIVDDSEGIEQTLRASMRSDWHEQESAIPWALEQLEKQGQRFEEKCVALICKTARELLDEDNTVLDRSSIDDLTLKTLKMLLDGGVSAYNTISSGRDFVKKVTECIRTMEDILNNPMKYFSPEISQEFRRRIHLWNSNLTSGIESISFGSLKTYNGNKRINTPTTQKHPLFNQLKEQQEALGTHQFLKIVSGDTILITLIFDAASIVATRWNLEKRIRGLLSYNDMLRLMHKAVFSTSTFLLSLRGRLRYGIIDEFQDTSITQWEIFKRIFVDKDSSATRLFLVGDPKQSIYSFQGADITSYVQAKEALVAHEGIVYHLAKNYRSLPKMIEGYNAIVGRAPNDSTHEEDWFSCDTAVTDTLCYPSVGAAGNMAISPERHLLPQHPLVGPPIYVMALEGNAPDRYEHMAKLVAMAIKKLRGTYVSLPDGIGWNQQNEPLDYKDFAIIVESHKLAEPFLAQCTTEGIPVVKYKMEGVFQSVMARDVHALLRAIIHGHNDPSFQCAMLLTVFFNRKPHEIDPVQDFLPCSSLAPCMFDNLCACHALSKWRYLAENMLWAQLFKSIQYRTGIHKRIMQLVDGERLVADLDQVIDYCLELLYVNNVSLLQLVEHLGRLYNNEETMGLDKNLHVLATDKSSVKVLTMHASKGLEFPVVFLVTGGSRSDPKGTHLLAWMGDDRKKHIEPLLSLVRNKQASDQRMQERRRLLYVALTRPQALLFVPLHFSIVARDDEGKIDWEYCVKPRIASDDDLTPRLQALCVTNHPEIEVFNELAWNNELNAPLNNALPAPAWSVDSLEKIPSVNILKTLCRQTSYSVLSKLATIDRSLDKSEEVLDVFLETQTQAKKERPVLPGGAPTGNALHVAIEALLREENIATCLKDPLHLNKLIADSFERSSVVFSAKESGSVVLAHEYASRCIRNALLATLILPDNCTLCLTDLKRADRIPEMEFLLGVSPHWVHGYMDLVFRVENKKAVHPWKYFILDWKSDQLEAFTMPNLEEIIVARHYDLQAKIYSHALDSYLRGVLQSDYNPDENLGGAVYMFLRGAYDSGVLGTHYVWTRKADPAADAEFVKNTVLKI